MEVHHRIRAARYYSQDAVDALRIVRKIIQRDLYTQLSCYGHDVQDKIGRPCYSHAESTGVEKGLFSAKI